MHVFLWNARARQPVEATLNQPVSRPGSARRSTTSRGAASSASRRPGRSPTPPAFGGPPPRGPRRGRGLRARRRDFGAARRDTDGVRAAPRTATRRSAPRPPQPNPPSDAMLAALLCAASSPSSPTSTGPTRRRRSSHARRRTLNSSSATPTAARPSPSGPGPPSSVASKLNGATWRTPFMVFHERPHDQGLRPRPTPVPPLAPFLLSGTASTTRVTAPPRRPALDGDGAEAPRRPRRPPPV